MAPSFRYLPLILAAWLVPAFAQTGPAGHWEGSIQLPDRELDITFDLARNGSGAWAGAFTQPAQNVRNVPLANIVVTGKSVKFTLVAGGASAPDFDCAIESAAAMRCVLSTQASSVAASMKRTGEAKLDLPKSSAAVSAEFEGDWEGAVQAPDGAHPLAVHIHNQPDKTVTATLDSPGQNATGLPLSDVVQSGNSLEFQLRLANASFKGAYNKDANEIAGQWSQSGLSFPLTLKKSAQK